MFSTLLIANRGEIACRIARTARALGIRTVAVCSSADRHARHVREADCAVELGGAAPAESYLHIERLIDAARREGATAVHPGYGFLSESAAFARASAEAGLTFVGPPPAAIEAMGQKDAAKATMAQAGVPVLPGVSLAEVPEGQWVALAQDIGFPVLVKAVAGGGGKGMRRVDAPGQLRSAVEGAQREAAAAFGDGRVLLEKLLERARHVEVQVFADRHGAAVHLFERDCSMQRRHQKVIEEAPAPGLSEAKRQAMGEAAVRAALAIGYEGAGTCEFLLDASGGGADAPFYFMEMNTRLQVEHPVTEAICGVDLVEWQLRVAAGEPLPRTQDQLSVSGHAVEVRLYAEDPARDYLPQTGQITHLRWPTGEGLRIDAGVDQGDQVSIHYDPLLAKLIAHGGDRAQALDRLTTALAALELGGVRTNAAQLAAIVRHPEFRAERLDTHFLARHREALLEVTERAQQRAVLLGAAALLLDRARKAQPSGQLPDPWAATDAFRPNAERVDWVRLQVDGEEVALRVRFGTEGYELGWGESTHVVASPRLGDASVEAFVDGVRSRAGARLHDQGVDVAFAGRQVRVHFERVSLDAAGVVAGGFQVRAPMPGRVVEVFVEASQSVTRGQRLLLLTAMKMEHALTADADAKVTRVHVDSGAQVEEGAVLVELEAAPQDEREESNAG